MDRLELRAHFWRIVGLDETAWSTTAGKITTAQVDDLINLGIVDFCKVAEPVHLHKTQEVTLVANQEEYAYASDLMKIRRNSRCTVNGIPLERLTESNVAMRADLEDFTVDNQFPLAIFDSGHDGTNLNFKLWPIPETVNTLKIYYLRRPVKLADLALDTTEYYDLPEEYHLYPVYWAAWHFYQANDDMAAKNVDSYMATAREKAEQLYRDTNEMMRGDMHHRTQATVFSSMLRMFEDDWDASVY